ncbi:MAG: S8 family serine peptidase, partial [Chloroflexota bacterium]|nr:S8 family serine peptidase [Chloroflexota bacterium]
MPYRAHFRSLAVAAVFTLLVSLALFIPNVSANDGDDVAVPPKPTVAYPNLSTHLNHLAESYGSGQMSQSQAAGEAPVHSGGSVAVTVYLDGYVSDVEAYLEDNGGDVRNVGVDYIEAYVPVGLLGSLSEQSGVLRVQEIIPPQPAYGNVTSQAVALHLADSWQDAGYKGQGVKVGVIDLELGGLTSLMGTELPSNVKVRCYTDIGVYTTNLSDCEAVSPVPPSVPAQCRDYVARLYQDNGHGTAVAEAIIDIAPEVSLYLAYPYSAGDMQEITRWMEGEGVSVINHSVGWIYDGPGDGTSPSSVSPLRTVDQAVAGDIIWLNSAGNNSDRTWFGNYYDPDRDGLLGFNSSNDEKMNFPFRECRTYTFQLRWEDSWGGASTDLDLYLYDGSDDTYIRLSVDEQSGASGHVPFERGGFRALSNSDDFAIVVAYEGGPVPDWIQLSYWGSGSFEHATGSGSIGNPAESANPGLLAVGAAPFYDINTIEPFSSQGPAPDGRTKPGIVGIDCAASVTYEQFDFRGNTCWFPGTSQASPHVAGMAALVRQRFPDFTAEQTAAYLKDNAEPRGAVPNNTWGYGLAKLPTADVGGCVHEITTDGTTNGQWSPQCQSTAADRGYAQYYSFTLDEDTQVTIELTSSVDPYLFLRAEEALSGDFLHENDDIQAGANTNSRIAATLAAGTYTIEATTYSTGIAGDFTLTLSGLGGDVEGEPTSDGCGFTLTADGATSGTWAAGCDSGVSGRGYAKYYTFTLAQQSNVIIDLGSDVDPFLYLRRGEARTGSVLHENDDVDPGSDTDSQISESLAAGTYTIEATTYAENQAGTFTLTISGLTGTATTEPDDEPDTCGVTLTADGSTSGTWAAGCESQVSGRGYAKYYTFTLT